MRTSRKQTSRYSKKQLRSNPSTSKQSCQQITHDNRYHSYYRCHHILLHVRRTNILIDAPNSFHHILQQHTLQAIDSQRISSYVSQPTFPIARKHPADQHHQRDAHYRPRQSTDKLHWQLQWIVKEHIIGEYCWLMPWYKQEDEERDN